jgi:methylenetetrahydrofolate--tRNA-(uracil-5-)-methyltransferase
LFEGDVTIYREEYIGNIATGLLAGLNASRLIFKEKLMVLPRESMLGALCYYITHADPKDFQPMKANFGLMPPLEVNIKGKRNRAKAYSQRSLEKLDIFMQAQTAHSHFCTH